MYLFMFVEIKFIDYHSYVIFVMKSKSICNNYVNYDEIIRKSSLVFNHMF